MAGKKQLAIKFNKVDMALVRIPVGHSRTGACTSRGKCNHGRRQVARKGK